MSSEDPHSRPQTLEEVLLGAEPTEEFLEELRILSEADEVSEWELTQQALAVAPKENLAAEKTEADYKTNESNLSVTIIVVITLAGLYWLTK